MPKRPRPNSLEALIAELEDGIQQFLALDRKLQADLTEFFLAELDKRLVPIKADLAAIVACTRELVDGRAHRASREERLEPSQAAAEAGHPRGQG